MFSRSYAIMTFQHDTAHLIRQGHVWARSIKLHGFVSSIEAKSLLGITLRHFYSLIGRSLFPMRRNRRLYLRVSEIAQVQRQRQVRIRRSRGTKPCREGVILMPTKADLEHRVAVLEEALEEACDLIKDVLETEDESESAD